MSEEELNEAMQYNLDYTEAMLSDELFGTNEVAEVKLLASEKAIKDLQHKVEQLEKEVDRLKYIKSKATNYLIKAIKIDSEDDNCMCLERHEYKILLDMLLNRELKEQK